MVSCVSANNAKELLPVFSLFTVKVRIAIFKNLHPVSNMLVANTILVHPKYAVGICVNESDNALLHILRRLKLEILRKPLKASFRSSVTTANKGEQKAGLFSVTSNSFDQ